jgi:hypothetical protein
MMNNFILIESEKLEQIQSTLCKIESTLSGNSSALPNLLRTSEVKKILKVKDSTLATLRANGTLPFAKIAGTIYYKLEDIKSLIEQNYSGTNEN